MSARVQYVLTDEAIQIVNNAATDRKRGDWLSAAIVEYNSIKSLVPSDDECGTLEQLAGRIGRMEKRLAALDSKVDTLLEKAS